MFDNRLADELRQRYGHRPPLERPEHWQIATDPSRQKQRDWMNSALALLGEPGRSRLFGRLQLDKHFHQTYNELATAAVLQSVGQIPAYEIDLNGQTPDLTVMSDGRPSLIVAQSG